MFNMWLQSGIPNHYGCSFLHPDMQKIFFQKWQASSQQEVTLWSNHADLFLTLELNKFWKMINKPINQYPTVIEMTDGISITTFMRENHTFQNWHPGLSITDWKSVAKPVELCHGCCLLGPSLSHNNLNRNQRRILRKSLKFLIWKKVEKECHVVHQPKGLPWSCAIWAS